MQTETDPEIRGEKGVQDTLNFLVSAPKFFIFYLPIFAGNPVPILLLFCRFTFFDRREPATAAIPSAGNFKMD